MSYSGVEFQFALEMIIANRNASGGATLRDIQADYYNAFGESLELLFGNAWHDYLRNSLLCNLDNLFVQEAPGGYPLYFIDEAVSFKRIHALGNNENIKEIMHKLNIDPNKMKTKHSPGFQVQGSFNSTSQRSVSSRTAPPKLAEFYNHTLIGDNFFLELSHIDLQMQKTKQNNVDRIGLCISGQTIKAAYGKILYSPYNFTTANVIVNIGTIDLLTGRSVDQMIADLDKLLNHAFQVKGLKAILTTLAPLPNHIGDEIDEKRQAFNKFIREEFKCIDIETCFLSNGNRVLLECYQGKPRAIGGTKHPVTLWNRVGRQRVLQLMKREIPNIHPILF